MQVALALCLLFAANEQQKRHDDWFFKAYPKAFEIDYAYNPPARLIALLLCGPGILVPQARHITIRISIFFRPLLSCPLASLGFASG